MKDRELWNAMRGIDPSYIIDAAPRETETVNRGGLLWRRWATVAACLVILLCAIPISRQVMNGFAPIGTGDETTDGYVNPDFVIEDGVLLLYTGDNPHVIIPDEVREISRDAFAEKGDVIETIYIGKNVEAVDSLFLSEVKHLASIEVAEENERFEIYEGVFVDKKANVYIDVLNNYADNISDFGALVWNLQEGTVDLKETELVFVLHNVRIHAFLEESGYEEMPKDLYVDRIEFKNNVIYGKENKTIRELFQGAIGIINLYQGDDYAMISRTSWGSGDIFLMTDDRVYDLSQNHDDMLVKDYNESFYYYSQGEDGALLYERMPVKFVPTMDGEQFVSGIRYGTGFDEFYKEKGRIVFENGQLKYIVTSSYTMEEAGVIDKYQKGFENFKYLFKEFETLEDLYEFNAKGNVVSAK